MAEGISPAGIQDDDIDVVAGRFHMIEQPAGIYRFIRDICLAVNRGSDRDQVIMPVDLCPMTVKEEQPHATLLLQAAGELADCLLHGAFLQICP